MKVMVGSNFKRVITIFVLVCLFCVLVFCCAGCDGDVAGESSQIENADSGDVSGTDDNDEDKDSGEKPKWIGGPVSPVEDGGEITKS